MNVPVCTPQRMSLPARALSALVRAYRLLLSPWLGSACRFEPTCSAWCAGGPDPVPASRPGLFSGLTPSSNHKKSS